MLSPQLWINPGAYEQEHATPLYFCHGVFIDRFIFRSNLLWMRLSWECHNQSQDTNWRHCFTRPELSFFHKRKGVLKIDQSVKMPWHRLSMGIASSCSSVPDKFECIQFLLTYNRLHLIQHSQTFQHLDLIRRCHNIFMSAPAVTFRRSNTLSNFLVGAKLNYTTLQKTPYTRGSFQCGSHCSKCTHIWNGRTSYIFPFIGERRPITHQVPCNSKNSVRTLSKDI